LQPSRTVPAVSSSSPPSENENRFESKTVNQLKSKTKLFN
jgi:hypothetical protein